MTQFQGACDEIGVPIAHEKTKGLAEVITYLGLEIDKVHKQIRIPAEKIQTTIRCIDSALAAKKLSLKQVQLGHCSFYAKRLVRVVRFSGGLSTSLVVSQGVILKSGLPGVQKRI